MTSDQIARMFFERLPKGGWLTVKQTRWLYQVARQEIERSGYHGPTRDAAGRPCVNGLGWELTIAPNGAGMLKRLGGM